MSIFLNHIIEIKNLCQPRSNINFFVAFCSSWDYSALPYSNIKYIQQISLNSGVRRMEIRKDFLKYADMGGNRRTDNCKFEEGLR